MTNPYIAPSDPPIRKRAAAPLDHSSEPDQPSPVTALPDHETETRLRDEPERREA
ncbi:hypothetical protein ACWELJ_02480 [Nocardia sp. NPDC004582]